MLHLKRISTKSLMSFRHQWPCWIHPRATGLQLDGTATYNLCFLSGSPVDAGLSSEESADRRLGVGHLVVRQPLVRPIGSVEDQFSSPWLFGQLCAFQFRRVTDSACLLLVSASQVEVSSEKDKLCMIELEHFFPSKFKDLVHVLYTHSWKLSYHLPAFLVLFIVSVAQRQMMCTNDPNE
jgi:hypothetical protein